MAIIIPSASTKAGLIAFTNLIKKENFRSGETPDIITMDYQSVLMWGYRMPWANILRQGSFFRVTTAIRVRMGQHLCYVHTLPSWKYSMASLKATVSIILLLSLRN